MPTLDSRRLFKRSWNGWTFLVIAIALLILAPIGVVLSSVLTNSGTVWNYLLATVLPDYISSSLWLMLGVGLCTVVIGVGTAWLVTMCRFPGQRLLEWALLLPLAAPAYVLAYVYTEMLEFYGPVQLALRDMFGWTSVNDYWFPTVRSLGGAIAIISLVLYPYVYLLSRVAFLEQSVCTLEASRLLGCNPWRSFMRVALPLARPAIVAGVSLVLMETLNDFGTVQYFAVNTFSVGIYRTWFGMGDRIAASQLSALLLVFVLLLIGLERWSRQQTRYHHTGRYQRLSAFRLRGWRAIAAIIVCGLPIVLGFLIPAGRLLYMATSDITHNFSQRFWELSRHSLILAAVTAIVAVFVSPILAYGLRLSANWGMQVAVRTATVGYAIPGAVIAVGVLFPIGAIDNAVDAGMRSTFGISTGLLLSGTIITLVFAYLVRFLAVSYNTVESSLSRIKPNLDDAARSLGCGTTRTLVQIHAPLMSGGLLTAAILVFVDVMKELPATLIVRPFNFDTLAVEVYRLAADERLAEAAAPALAIVAVGIIPVIALSRQITRTRPEEIDYR
ncbi:iron ABC transporter permease [Chroococcidiopsis cubana CCALA 043]|uniref:ABC transporter permease n=1 Tax=Chroococcidiopsis cubana TaxID=171392 RepID=UPI000D075C90|nr:iron ABC transporter permease [Chroococcidiopsis cubana]PSB64809.1 iron ABC transporter permease [Chroococcidiopsis cubana CCALA 043]